MCRLDLREADCWSLRRRPTVCKARLAASAKPWGESMQQGKPTFRYSIACAFTMFMAMVMVMTDACCW